MTLVDSTVPPPPKKQVVSEAPLFGFEQEYTMLSKGSGLVLGWPEGGYPAPQVCTVFFVVTVWWVCIVGY